MAFKFRGEINNSSIESSIGKPDQNQRQIKKSSEQLAACLTNYIQLCKMFGDAPCSEVLASCWLPVLLGKVALPDRNAIRFPPRTLPSGIEPEPYWRLIGGWAILLVLKAAQPKNPSPSLLVFTSVPPSIVISFIL